MFARTFLASILCVVALFTESALGGEISGPNFEKEWQGQRQANVEITINLERGKILFALKDLKDRTMTDPVITLFDENQKEELVIRAEDAEFRYASEEGKLWVTIRNCHFQSPNGDGFLKTKVFCLPLPQKK